jgi:hypothetical protein
MKKLFMVVSVLWALLSHAALAQQPPVDLSLSVQISPPYPWVPGTEGSVSFFAVNNGFFAVRSQLELLNRGEAPPDVDRFEILNRTCPTVAECENFGRSCYDMGVALPGQSKQCQFFLRAIERRQRRIEVVWRLYDGNFQSVDPNLSNNTVRFTPEVAAFNTQVPLSPWGYSLLGILLFGLGTAAARRS